MSQDNKNHKSGGMFFGKANNSSQKSQQDDKSLDNESKASTQNQQEHEVETVSNTNSTIKYNPQRFVNGVDFTPKDVYEYLDQFVVGQDDAKRTLAVVAFKHYLRFSNPKLKSKSNVLLVGPSGSGKTYLITKLAEFLKVPVSFGDATTVTEKGYVGDDVESFLEPLVQLCDGDKQVAEAGIVFIDEFDKISERRAIDRVDIRGKGVQMSLLKLIEGSNVRLPRAQAAGMKSFSDAPGEMNTSNILFIFAGAFDGIEEIVRMRVAQELQKEPARKIGFQIDSDKSKEKSEFELINPQGLTKSQLLNYLKTEDIIKYGFMPEIVGRIPILTTLAPLKIVDLVDILNIKEGIVEENASLFESLGVKLYFSYQALCTIGMLAIAKQVGARGLRAIVEQVFNNTFFELPTLVANAKNNKIDGIVVTADVVKYNLDPYYVQGVDSLKLTASFKENSKLLKSIKSKSTNSEQITAIEKKEREQYFKDSESEEIKNKYKDLLLSHKEEYQLRQKAREKFKQEVESNKSKKANSKNSSVDIKTSKTTKSYKVIKNK